jgi:hypothetical protein
MSTSVHVLITNTLSYYLKKLLNSGSFVQASKLEPILFLKKQESEGSSVWRTQR